MSSRTSRAFWLAGLAAAVVVCVSTGSWAQDPIVEKQSPPTVDRESFRVSGDAERGAVLFARSCAACHGARGDGHGTVRLTDVDMPDFSDRVSMSSHTDWDLYRIIADGGRAHGLCEKMLPAGHRFDEQSIHDLAAYVKSLPVQEYIRRARKD
jgi:mono/diheme cytochrome c family protein